MVFFGILKYQAFFSSSVRFGLCCVTEFIFIDINGTKSIKFFMLYYWHRTIFIPDIKEVAEFFFFLEHSFGLFGT